MRVVGAVLLVVPLLTACSTARTTAPSPAQSATMDGGTPDAYAGGARDMDACLTCSRFDAPGPACTTSLSGTVFDPAGLNPLFNVAVFVPSDPLGHLPAITQSTPLSNQCDWSISDYVAATATDATGHFKLTGVPATTHVPLVVQTGKWRREVFLDAVKACVDNPVPASLTRLPRNQGEGDLPQMAVLTGQCDGLPCFMRSVGLDATEFTGPNGGGRLHVYRGAGPGPDLGGGGGTGGAASGDCTGTGGPCPLWSTRQELERYDIVLLGCECGAHDETKPDKTPMHDWIDEGGKVVAIHDQSTWLRNGPADFQAVASWVTGPDAGASGPFAVDTTFAGGMILHNWLAGVGALNADGTIPLNPADVSTSLSAVNAPATRWIFDSSQSPADAKYFFLLTPDGGLSQDAGFPTARYYGQVIFADVHVGSGGSVSSAPVPSSCSGGALTAEGKALEFLFFGSDQCVLPSPTKEVPRL